MIPIKSAPDKELPMGIKEIIAQAKWTQERARVVNVRIKYLEEKIPLTCGISNRETYLALLERINRSPRIVEQLSVIQREGIRMWVNYVEMMKEPVLLDETGSIQIAADATIRDISDYFGIVLI